MNETLMFDFSNFYDRVAKELPNDCKVAEIGIADGISALYLAEKLNGLGKKFTLYMIDNMDYGGYIQLCTIYENIIKSGLGGSIKVVPKDSIEASKDFNEGELNFIFLDSSHEYIETRESIKAWYPKLKDGSILSGHDYYLYEGVKKAVDELIPETFQRETIDTEEQFQEFEPEQFKHIQQTNNGYGLWYCIKDFYKTLNNI